MKRKQALALLDELRVMFRLADSTECLITKDEKGSSSYELAVTWIPKRREALLLRKLSTQHDLHIEVCKDKTTFQKKASII